VDGTSKSGVPITEQDLHGTGGGSFCNHSFNPNAELVRSHCDEGYGILVVAIADIRRGSFIHVNYGKGFLRSKKTNLM
jgi:hypothetical protein